MAFEIYKEDLTAEAQKELCEYLGITDLKEMNYDIYPIAVIE